MTLVLDDGIGRETTSTFLDSETTGFIPWFTSVFTELEIEFTLDLSLA